MTAKIVEGNGTNGEYMVQIRLKQGDPLAQALCRLAELAGNRRVDLDTGFVEPLPAEPQKIKEIEETILGFLRTSRPEVYEKILAGIREVEEARKSVNPFLVTRKILDNGGLPQPMAAVVGSLLPFIAEMKK